MNFTEGETLKGQRALVTGGSSGIGAAVCVECFRLSPSQTVVRASGVQDVPIWAGI